MSIVDENEKYLDPVEDPELEANCEYCRFFEIHCRTEIGFCTGWHEFVEPEDREEDCTAFELVESYSDDYNNWKMRR